ncbi:uncharacterized protein PV06_02493 [Exophiala oligosperma]|uniref:Uncharacterized protein n=2 Tax=Chaetothyriales TaxID=34395 RepID=A0A0D2EFZ3_9EURO|nr:uncharacterized protein PV06_02493 [Exophiala oligosperma]KAJ9630320.1 hypothetical protein H2204_008538 [Knufia peltigerae]KIW46869.1 hypothetical protein PV06_02493 [Exophiala oligosperma]
MASGTHPAEPGHWFLRGVQSACFYYISLTPCLEFQHKRKRKQEARAAKAPQTDIVTTQPRPVTQPRAFETNEAWAYELMLGPGPPKGWKGDTLLRKYQKHMAKKAKESDETEAEAEPDHPRLQSQPTMSSQVSTQPTLSSTRPPPSATATTVSDTQSTSDKASNAPSRPFKERHLSSAYGYIKDSLIVNLHPEGWNWKKYNREDEDLFGFGAKMKGLWNRAVSSAHNEGSGGQVSTQQRKRAETTTSEGYDYQRGRNPEVNDLHPPIVSQLPATSADARWMLLGPPSGDVMMGRKQATEEPEWRWPMALLGGTKARTFFDEDYEEPPLRMTRSVQQLDAVGVDKDTASMQSIISDMDEACSLDEGDEEGPEVTSITRVKHMSDPVIRPPPVHPRPSVVDDLFVLKRRGSWQFHYIVPNKPTVW